MSASICWRPTDNSRKHISVGAPSSFMQTMDRAGLRLPCTLGENELPTLRGMAATWSAPENANPYQQIIDLIEQHGEIDLFAEY